MKISYDPQQNVAYIRCGKLVLVDEARGKTHEVALS